MEKLKAMWEVLMGRAIVYNVRLRKAAESGDGALTIRAGEFAALEPTRGKGIFVAGASEIG